VHQPIRGADGTVVAMANVTRPLDEQAQGYFADMVAALTRKALRDDPLGLRGDKQQRAIDRTWRRPTAGCTSLSPAGALCDRTAGHPSLHLHRTPGCCHAWSDTSGGAL
jgi:hypothetical protein